VCLAIQVLDDKADDVLAGGGVQFFPGEHLVAKGQRAPALGDRLCDPAILIQVQLLLQHGELVARLSPLTRPAAWEPPLLNLMTLGAK
jgi:hypothetical protein